MIDVRNKHASKVGGVDAGALGQVTQEVIDRYPWALIPLVEPKRADDRSGSAAGARAAILDSKDLGFVRQFVDDERSTVRAEARRRVKALE